MSTASRERRVAHVLLADGDHLDQSEFHRRYEEMPLGIKAELIDGVVYMPSPVGEGHSVAHSVIQFWLNLYRMATPGVVAHDNATFLLDARSELQPDAALVLAHQLGGGTRPGDGYIRGTPELVIEVAKSSRYIDLGPKLAEYSRVGVPEYIVRALAPDKVFWSRHVDGSLTEVAPDQDGLYRSTVFPGLWLDPVALQAEDLLRLKDVIDFGTRSPEHAAFVARLTARREELRGDRAE